MPYTDITNRQTKDLTPQIHTQTFWGENMLAGMVLLDPNAYLAEHSHPHEQITFIIEGELNFDLNGEKRKLHAGDLVIIPGSMRHSGLAGPQGARLLDVFSPCREDMKY